MSDQGHPNVPLDDSRAAEDPAAPAAEVSAPAAAVGLQPDEVVDPPLQEEHVKENSAEDEPPCQLPQTESATEKEPHFIRQEKGECFNCSDFDDCTNFCGAMFNGDGLLCCFLLFISVGGLPVTLWHGLGVACIPDGANYTIRFDYKFDNEGNRIHDIGLEPCSQHARNTWICAIVTLFCWLFLCWRIWFHQMVRVPGESRAFRLEVGDPVVALASIGVNEEGEYAGAFDCGLPCPCGKVRCGSEGILTKKDDDDHLFFTFAPTETVVNFSPWDVMQSGWKVKPVNMLKE